MEQTMMDFIRSDDGWSPTMRLRFHHTREGRFLYQLWLHLSGREEWRAISVVDMRQGGESG